MQALPFLITVTFRLFAEESGQAFQEHIKIQ
jgi:hypothetical protein